MVPDVYACEFGVEAVFELEGVAAAEAVAATEVQRVVECELHVVPEHSISSKQQTKPHL